MHDAHGNIQLYAALKDDITGASTKEHLVRTLEILNVGRSRENIVERMDDIWKTVKYLAEAEAEAEAEAKALERHHRHPQHHPHDKLDLDLDLDLILDRQTSREEQIMAWRSELPGSPPPNDDQTSAASRQKPPVWTK